MTITLKSLNYHRALSFLLWVISACCLMLLSQCKKNDNTTPSNLSPDLKLVADGFVSPVQVIEPPDASKRLFVVDQAGKIWIINPDGTKRATPFLDITSRM